MREGREPRPERDHPVGQMLYGLNRNEWGFLFKAKQAGADGQELQKYKDAICTKLDEVKKAIQAF